MCSLTLNDILLIMNGKTFEKPKYGGSEAKFDTHTERERQNGMCLRNG